MENTYFSNQAIAALGLWLGFKTSYIRKEAERFGVDYDAGRAELIANGIKFTRANRGLNYKLFRELTGCNLASQTGQYMNGLGFYSDLDRIMGNPMEQLAKVTL